jgi:hypothetical protein
MFARILADSDRAPRLPPNRPITDRLSAT